jgi:hypothetical protein
VGHSPLPPSLSRHLPLYIPHASYLCSRHLSLFTRHHSFHSFLSRHYCGVTTHAIDGTSLECRFASLPVRILRSMYVHSSGLFPHYSPPIPLSPPHAFHLLSLVPTLFSTKTAPPPPSPPLFLFLVASA